MKGTDIMGAGGGICASSTGLLLDELAFDGLLLDELAFAWSGAWWAK
jgi:hypothetical protein